MKELDTIVLTRDIPEHELHKGDVGAIVHVYREAKAFEVEFVTADGMSQAVLTLTNDEIRPMASKEILHVRKLSGQAA